MKIKLVVVLAVLGLTVACVPAEEFVAEAVVLTQAAQPTPTSAPTFTPLPTHTPEPTFTPLPTHTPNPTLTPQPTAETVVIVATSTPVPLPVVFLEMAGYGPQVSEDYDWAPCEKMVFSWTTGGNGGRFTVRLRKTHDPEFDERLISAREGQTEGQALLQLAERDVYFIEVRRGPREGWTITGECLDTPAAEE